MRYECYNVSSPILLLSLRPSPQSSCFRVGDSTCSKTPAGSPPTSATIAASPVPPNGPTSPLPAPPARRPNPYATAQAHLSNRLSPTPGRRMSDRQLRCGVLRRHRQCEVSLHSWRRISPPRPLRSSVPCVLNLRRPASAAVSSGWASSWAQWRF